MRRAVAIVTALLVVAVPAALARKPITCKSGNTVYSLGRLRIFSVHFIDRNGPEGSYFGDAEYYCFGARKPVRLATDGADQGVGSDTTYAYAFDGRRYLAIEQGSDSEGGPDAYYEVVDVRTDKVVHYENLAFNSEDPAPPFLVSGGGVFISMDDNANLYWVPPGRGAEERQVNKEGTSDPAVVGNTLYWTEPGGVRSAQLPGAADAPEGRALRSLRFRRKRDDCGFARGRTVAASPSVRVYIEPGGIPTVCRIGGDAVSLNWTPRVQAQFTRDRWVLLRGPAGQLSVVYSRSSEEVVSVLAGVAAATLLSDGAAAWLTSDGAVMKQAPGALPQMLAPAGSGASALASAGTSVYWTAGGMPHSD